MKHISEAELLKECDFIERTLVEIDEGKRIFERSLSIGISRMPVVGTPALWITISDSALQIFISKEHLAIGVGRPNTRVLVDNNGIDDNYIVMNHKCINGEDDLFSYRLLYPAGCITLEGLNKLRSTAEFAQKYIKIKDESFYDTTYDGTIFDPSFSL